MKKRLKPITDYIRIHGHFVKIGHVLRKSVGIAFSINIRSEKFGIIFEVGFG